MPAYRGLPKVCLTQVRFASEEFAHDSDWTGATLKKTKIDMQANAKSFSEKEICPNSTRAFAAVDIYGVVRTAVCCHMPRVMAPASFDQTSLVSANMVGVTLLCCTTNSITQP